MKKYIVCDWYYPKADINIDGIGTSFEEAKDILKADVENLLSDYGYQLWDWPDDDFEAVPGPDANCTDSVWLRVNSEDDISLEVNDEIICNWFIKAVDIPLTSMEKEEIFREVQHDYHMEDIKNYFEEHEEEYSGVISEEDFDDLLRAFEKSEDCDYAFNDTMRAVFDDMYYTRLNDEPYILQKVIAALDTDKVWRLYISEDCKHFMVDTVDSGATPWEDAEFYKFILNSEKCNLREDLDSDELYNAVIKLAEKRGVRHEN